MTEREIVCQGYDIAHGAAIVCSHVASGELPIRLARRDAPAHDIDTGWQFHCDVHDHRDDEPEVVSVLAVVERDPTVEAILDNPPRSCFRREDATSPWVVEDYHKED